MPDMSKTNQAYADILRAILDNGPLTLYSASRKTKLSIGTVHRHLKQLHDSGKIRIYNLQDNGRKKIEYGPTLFGMLNFYRNDRDFAKKIENYFLLWIDNPQFQKDLESEGFDISPTALKNSKEVFRKYMDYFSAIETQIEKIKNGNDAISRDILIIISSEMLSSNPSYYKLWMELYAKLPGMQKSLDEYMATMIRSYNEFKRNFKKAYPQTRKLLQRP